MPRRRAAPVGVDRLRRPPPRADAGVAPHRRRAEARAAGDVHRRRLVRAHRLARRGGAAAVDVLPDVLRVHEPQLLRPRHPQGPPLAAEVAVVPLVRRPRRLPAVHLAHVHHRLALRHHRVGDDDRRRHADDLHQRADRLGLGERPAASASTPPPPPHHLRSAHLHLLLSRRSTASASSSRSASCWRSTSPSTSTPTGSRSCCCCTSCARSSSTTPRRPTRRRAAARRRRARRVRSSPATPTI